jgi:hypothetical protein
VLLADGSLGVIKRLTEAQLQFFQPSLRVKAMDETAQEAEFLSHVTAILENLFPGDLTVDRQEFGNTAGLGEEVSRVARLRRLHDYRLLKIEDVFRPKEVKATSTLAKLLVIESVVVRLPCN